jgi:hypothetical protein
MSSTIPISTPLLHKGVSVFVSYSIEDEAMVQKVSDYLSHFSNVKFWNKSKEPGKEDYHSLIQRESFGTI